MALTTKEFQATLAEEKQKPHKAPRVDSFPSDEYFDALGEEVERHPIGGHGLRGPAIGPID